MKKLFILLLLSFPLVVVAQEDCKCNINNVLVVDQNINSLTAEHLDLFLCTFGESCVDNVEYAGFSNEVLFLVLKNEPELLIERIQKNKRSVDLNSIIEEIGNPVSDLFNLKEIKENVSRATGNRRIKKG